MIKFSDYKIFIKGIFLAILIFITLLYFSVRQTAVTNSTAAWVAQTQEVLFHSEKLLLDAANIETGASAFLLTRHKQFLDLFKESRSDVMLELQSIKKLTADNYSQQSRLDSLNLIITKRIIFSDSVISLERGINIAEGIQIVNLGKGNAYTEQIRLLVRQIQEEENRLLKERQSAHELAITVQHKLFICLVLAMLIVLLFVFWNQKGLSVKKEKVKEETLFKNLLESAPEAMVIADQSGQIIFINQQAEILFNYDKALLIGLPVETLIPGGLGTGAGNNLPVLKAQKSNGSIIPAEVSIAPIQTAAGKLISVCVRDLTERNKQTERERKSEEFFRLLVTGIKDYAIFMLDAAGRVASWNAGAERIKGYTEKEILGQSFELFYSAEDIQKGEPWKNLALAGQYGHFEKEGWRLRKDGSRFWANVVFTAQKDNEGNVYGYSKITRDITERKQAQEQQEFLSRQIEQSNDAIYIVGADRKLKSWNKGAEKLYGYTKQDVLGKDANILLQTDFNSQEFDKVLQGLALHDYWTGEIKRITKAGDEIIIHGATTTVRNEEGIITGYVSSGYDITVEKKLIREVIHLAGIVEQSSEAIFSRGKDRRIISWNRGAEKLFGFSKSEAVGRTPQELGFIDMNAQDLSAVEQQIINNGQWTSEMKYYHKDGSSFFGVVTANLSRNENGSIASFNFIVKDISLRKQTEEQLKQLNEELEQRVAERTAEIFKNEQRFRLLIENSAEGVSLLDEFSNVIYRSPGGYKMIGDSPLQQSINFAHPQDFDTFKNRFAESLSKPLICLPYAIRFKHSTGHYFWTEGTFTNMLKVEGVNAIVANYRDVTKRKELEDLLHKANVLARIGGWEIDLIKGTVYWTDITREIHETSPGYQPDIKTGINFYKEGKGRDLIEQKVKDAIECGKPWDVELQIITAKNNERWIRTIGETEFVNGKCIRVYGSFQDIDQRKKADEKIKKINIELEERVAIRTIELKKTNEELEAFSYSVSHDLRAPLRAIIGFTSKLEINYSNQLDDEAKRITSVIKSNTLKMGLLIDDLLSFSRMGRQEINKLPIDSNLIVKEIVESISAGLPAKIEWVIHTLPAINADINTIRQVWINLIANAVKYSGKAASPRIEIGSKNENEMVVFFVKDNGVGFNDKYKAKLFKVFQRLHSGTEFEGTGIGLAIVEKIVSKHGGFVTADGAVNEGACFSFSLPV